jgi:Transglutaminase-like superfamily
MRSLLVLSCVICFTTALFSQNDKGIDFSKIDKFALKVPDSVTTDFTKLASYLTTSPFSTSTEKKMRAIYVWVSQNIQYDKSFDLTSPFTTVDVVATQDADRVLAARKGVCMGYSQLFVALAQAAGLKAEMVEGIIKQRDGTIPRMGHAWVAVRLRKKGEKNEKTETQWYLCDPTWASPPTKSGYGTINEDYFLVEPEDFIKDHMPIDPMWQLVEKPVTVDIFSKESDDKIKKYVSKSSKNPFLFQDTINRFLKMDTLKRLEKSTWRMLHYNPVNEYIWFEVGKVYSNRFTAHESKIADLIQNSLAESTILADDEKFERMLGVLRLYGETFKDCFSKIDDKTIAKQVEYYSDDYLNALISAYRSGYHTALLNKIIEGNTRTTPRFLEMFIAAGHTLDSTLSSARKSVKLLDTLSQRSIEMRLQYFEQIAHQKRSVFLFQHIEALRTNPAVVKKKKDIYDLLSQGRMHTRKYQECADSISMIMFGMKNAKRMDDFYDNYSFLFDIEECAFNSHFLFQEIEEKSGKIDAKGLMSYVQNLKDSYGCTVNVQDKWRNTSKTIDTLIKLNTGFFKEIAASNESQLVSVYHNIAINLWNENLTKDKALIKTDLRYYLNLAEGSINKGVEIYKDLMGKKVNETLYKAQIDSLEEQRKEILKLKKEAD